MGGTPRTPNRRLVGARRRRGLTQDQVAELARGAHWRLFEREAPIDADYLSKLERGVITWPGSRYRAALRAVFGVAGDAELGFGFRRGEDPPDTVVLEQVDGRGSSDVNRQAFLRVLGISAGTAMSDQMGELLGQAEDTDTTPARVGRADLEQVQYAIAVFGDWQDRYGGGVCTDAIAGQVRWAGRRLEGTAPGGLRWELYSAVGFLADIAGWGGFDAGQHERALRYFRAALHCAEQAGDWGLRANVLSDMARQAVYRGHLEDALSLIELAQVRQDRLTPTVRAMLSTVRARALAAHHRPGDALGAVSAAEDHFAHSDPAGDPEWITYFTAPHLAADAGHALYDVAVGGQLVTEATDRLRTAVVGYPPSAVRSRALAYGKLATIELLHGDRDAGVAAAHQMLDLGTGLHSRRATDDLHRLRRATDRHGHGPVVQLRQRIDHTLSA